MNIIPIERMVKQNNANKSVLSLSSLVITIELNPRYNLPTTIRFAVIGSTTLYNDLSDVMLSEFSVLIYRCSSAEFILIASIKFPLLSSITQ